MALDTTQRHVMGNGMARSDAGRHRTAQSVTGRDPDKKRPVSLASLQEGWWRDEGWVSWGGVKWECGDRFRVRWEDPLRERMFPNHCCPPGAVGSQPSWGRWGPRVSRYCASPVGNVAERSDRMQDLLARKDCPCAEHQKLTAETNTQRRKQILG